MFLSSCWPCQAPLDQGASSPPWCTRSLDTALAPSTGRLCRWHQSLHRSDEQQVRKLHLAVLFAHSCFCVLLQRLCYSLPTNRLADLFFLPSFSQRVFVYLGYLRVLEQTDWLTASCRPPTSRSWLLLLRSTDQLTDGLLSTTISRSGSFPLRSFTNQMTGGLPSTADSSVRLLLDLQVSSLLGSPSFAPCYTN